MELPPIARHRGVAAALAVACVAAACYGGTLGHGFALDDVSEVVRNDDIRSLRTVGRLFTRGAWEGAGEVNPIYRPLTSVTYAVNHALTGLSPVGFHVANVLLHVCVSLLVLRLASSAGLQLGAATLGALLFAVHPVHVEVVANVAGRKDALAAAFVLLTVLAHAAALRTGRRGYALLAPVALAAALFSKETGAAALAAVAAWDLLLGRASWARSRKRALALYAVYAAELVLYFWARRAAVGAFGVPLAAIPFVENPLAHAGAAPRVLTAVAVVGKGLALLVFPASLSPDYSWNAIPVVSRPLAPRVLAAAAAVAASCWVAWRRRREQPVLAFAACWYAAALLPGSNLLVPIGTTFGERLLYVPSVGFCLAAASLAQGALARVGAGPRRAAAAIAAVAVLALAGRTVAYASAWKDEVSLFTAAVRAEPASAKAHQLLGAALMEEGRGGEGVHELELAVRALEPLETPEAGSRVQLGVAYERVGRVADAAALYEGVLRRVPDHPDALWRLGVVRWTQGRRDEAVRLWERTLAVAPDHARAMSDLGIARYQLGDAAAAEALWLRAAEVDARGAGPWLSLGNLYERRGDLVRARAAWERFLELARYGVYPGQREAVAERLRALSARGGQ